MSADDQRAADDGWTPIPATAACPAECEDCQVTVDRLRAELAETRAELHGATGAAAVLRERGDALADAKNWVGHVVEAERWRSVRGDATAPAEPSAADGAECHSARSDGHGCLGRVVDGQCTEQDDHHPTPGMVPCCGPGEHDEPTAGPAVELPVTLSSVDDVAAVCERAGLTETDGRGGDPRERAWDDGTVTATDRGGLLWVTVRGPGTVWISTIRYRQPAQILVAAIEAARGGSR